ncbi:MAG: hypothetical protein Kapaf2KO_20680 [Candidatus Kapaibacteriales bacterium]
MTLEKRDYNGSEPRVDGYYYKDYPNTRRFYFLWRNGVLYETLLTLSEVENIELEFRTGERDKSIQSRKRGWGLFNINNNSILTEKWGSSPRNFSTFHYTSLIDGIILNDTTFVLRERFGSKNKNDISDNEFIDTFRFRQLTPKPDSTNNYTN